MATLASKKSQVISLEFQKTIKGTNDLLTFSGLYTEEMKKIIKKLQANEGKTIRLFFTRISKNCLMEDLGDFFGIPNNITEKSFDFTSGRIISLKMYSDNDFINHIRFDNILGVIPSLGIIRSDQIIETRNTELAQKYFSFKEDVIQTLKTFIEKHKDHHIKIFLSNNYVIEGEVLEINKSNLLILMSRKRTEDFNTVILGVSNENVYFIEKDYFIKKILIFPSKETFGLHDDGGY